MGSSTMSQTFSPSDVASHNKADNLWIIVDQDVYDLTKFQDEHPGGKKILQRVAGKDASKQFWKYHNESILKKYSKQLQVGSLDSKLKAQATVTFEFCAREASQIFGGLSYSRGGQGAKVERL